MPNIRSVEYYRLWDDHTWDTEFIDIPADTPDERLEEGVREAATRIDWLEGPPVLVGLYCSQDDELAETQAADEAANADLDAAASKMMNDVLKQRHAARETDQS